MPAREILIGQPVAEVETLAPLLSEKCGRKVVITQPQRGEKRQLVDMAMKNLRDAALKRERRLANAYSRTLGALHELQEVLGIENLPLRIEGYDISNTQGAQSVGSMVVMKGGLSSNKDYRIFRIQHRRGAERLRQHARGHHPPPDPRPEGAARSACLRGSTRPAASSPSCPT